MQIVHMQPLESSLSASDRLVQPLRKDCYLFRAQSAHHQEVNDANYTYAASGIVTLCK